MTKVNELPTLSAVEDGALVYVFSPANPATPDRQMTLAALRARTLAETLENKNYKFAAVQVPDPDPNTLDDYEESTFTPTIVGTTAAGAGTYTLQQGRYTKIGRQVTFDCEVTWTAHTGTGNMKLGGLPFPLAAAFAPVFQILAENLTFANQLACQGDAGLSTASIGVMATGAAFAALAIDAAATVRVSGSYCV